MKLEWLTIQQFARELGVSPNVVRSAIRRHKLLHAGDYLGESWTLYAEKRGRDWRIPVVRKPDTGLWFETRTEFERYLQANGGKL
jgi:hypothetical protein